MTVGRLLFFCCLIGASFARTDLEIKDWIVKQAVECSKDIPVSNEDFHMMTKENQFPENKNARCVVACVFKNIGMVNDKGMFDEVSALKMSEEQYAGDKEKVESCKKLYEICKKVNDEPVTDGDSGCERSALLATCLSENAPKMGFTIKK